MPLIDYLDPVLLVDTQKFRAAYDKLNFKIINQQLALNESVGFSVNVGSAKDLQKLFMEKCGCTPLRISLKTHRPSFSMDVIKNYDTPYTKPVMDLKHLRALEKYFKIAENALHDGKITFSLQEESVTGRVYASEPNVMCFPAEIRETVVPEPGTVFLYADYKSEELCIMAFLVGETKLLDDVRNGVDIFTELSKDLMEREEAKLATYAFCYGAEPKSIASKVYKSEAIVLRFLDRLFDRYPKLREWVTTPTKVIAQGYSETLFGNRYNINTANHDTAEEVRRAVNFIVQGSAADILRDFLPKVAAIEGAKVKLTVFDSILVQVPQKTADRCEKQLKEIMESYLEGKLRVSVRRGSNWRSAWEKENAPIRESSGE